MNTFDSRYMVLKESKLKQIIRKEKTVVAVAQELQVSRQSVHKWLLRYQRYGIEGLISRTRTSRKVAPNKTPQATEELVVATARQHWVDGVETLHDHLLSEHNLDLHPVTIYRILKRRGVRYTTSYPHTRQKWKKRLYAHQTPGLELQMDTKYPYGYKQGQVMYTIIDDATRWVFAWTYEQATAQNTLDFLDKVYARAPFPIQKIRTDQGKEFIANVVRDYLKSRHTEHRLNTPYCPEENGKIERFHRTLNEKGLRFGFNPNDSLETTQYHLSLFLQYYNWRKKHRGLGMDRATPVERLRDLGSVNLTLQCYIC